MSEVKLSATPRGNGYQATIPSPLIGGEDHAKGVMRLPARAAMIINGDIAVQLDAASPNAELIEVSDVLDVQGRPRVKLIWSK